MANWRALPVDPAGQISGLAGSWASLNGKPQFYRDPTTLNIYCSASLISDDPKPRTFDLPEPIFAVDLTPQSIANITYGRCRALSAADDAYATLTTGGPIDPNDLPDPFGGDAQKAAKEAAAVNAKLQALNAAKLLTDSGIAKSDPVFVLVQKKLDEADAAIAALPPDAQPIIAG